GVKITDFDGDHLTTTNSSGNYTWPVILGDVTVTLDESSAPVGSEISAGHNPMKVKVTDSTLTLPDTGFTIKPKKGKPAGSIGNGLVFFNDTVYGGPGDDFMNGGGGDDWLI